MADLIVGAAKDPAAVSVGTPVILSFDPATGGANVALVGGAVGGSTVAQGDPNAGGADAWPVSLEVDGDPITATNGVPVVAQTTSGDPRSTTDQTATGTPTALTALVRGPGGLLIMAHPLNPAGSIVRISGSDVSTTKGTPLGPGASYIDTSVANANQLYLVIEAGAAPKICTRQV
jgi:hypothetical protein